MKWHQFEFKKPSKNSFFLYLDQTPAGAFPVHFLEIFKIGYRQNLKFTDEDKVYHTEIWFLHTESFTPNEVNLNSKITWWTKISLKGIQNLTFYQECPPQKQLKIVGEISISKEELDAHMAKENGYWLNKQKEMEKREDQICKFKKDTYNSISKMYRDLIDKKDT